MEVSPIGRTTVNPVSFHSTTLFIYISECKLDLDFGQPKRFPSTEVQDDWQLRKEKLDLDFGQPKRFPSTEVQDDWQVKKEKLDLDFGQPKGSQVLRSRMTGKF